jgi:26S proteasome regulatory subunit N2
MTAVTDSLNLPQKEETAKKEEEVKKEEPLFEVLSNPARVMRPQLQVIAIDDPPKYKPIKDVTIGGSLPSLVS